jgi:hypothetical protein
LLLQNSKGRKIPFVWHATGTPDFWAGVNRHGMWIEFKRGYSRHLTREQKEFRLSCEAQQH